MKILSAADVASVSFDSLMGATFFSFKFHFSYCHYSSEINRILKRPTGMVVTLFNHNLNYDNISTYLT